MFKTNVKDWCIYRCLGGQLLYEMNIQAFCRFLDTMLNSSLLSILSKSVIGSAETLNILFESHVYVTSIFFCQEYPNNYVIIQHSSVLEYCSGLIIFFYIGVGVFRIGFGNENLSNT